MSNRSDRWFICEKLVYMRKMRKKIESAYGNTYNIRLRMFLKSQHCQPPIKLLRFVRAISHPCPQSTSGRIMSSASQPTDYPVPSRWRYYPMCRELPVRPTVKFEETLNWARKLWVSLFGQKSCPSRLACNVQSHRNSFAKYHETK